VARIEQEVRRRYGAHPAHLVALSVGFVIAALALHVLLGERRLDVGKWLVGSAVLHDAVLVPAYIAADATLVAVWRRRPGRVPWLNYVRFPAAISAVGFLVYSPLILRKAESFQYATGRNTHAYLSHWLFVTALLFAVSGVGYLTRWMTRRG
jgi:pimeloyl-ACP methyl ester carboxylesterase